MNTIRGLQSIPQPTPQSIQVVRHHRRNTRSRTTLLTPRQWARHCMWNSVALNCGLFGFLIVASLWSGQIGQHFNWAQR